MNKPTKILISVALALLVTYFIISFFYFIVTLDITNLAISGSILCIIMFSSIFYEIIK